jgi:hypothetical protein
VDEVARVAWEGAVAEELGHASCLGKVLAGGVEVSDCLIERRCVGGVDIGKILIELGVGGDLYSKASNFPMRFSSTAGPILLKPSFVVFIEYWFALARVAEGAALRQDAPCPVQPSCASKA